MLEGGRWNSPGSLVIYAGLSQSGAMLEILVHANIGRLPRTSQLIVIEIPDSIKIETFDTASLPGWDHPNMVVSRLFGDTWVQSGRSVALLVPSVIAKHDKNIVINQMHPDAGKIIAGNHESLQWDSRLFTGA